MVLQSLIVTGVVLGGILFLNVQRYFKAYISGLPYQDTPIGRLIADYADALPADTQVYMVGCCWEHSIPDRFVDKEVARPQNWHYIDARDLSCLQLQYPAVARGLDLGLSRCIAGAATGGVRALAAGSTLYLSGPSHLSGRTAAPGPSAWLGRCRPDSGIGHRFGCSVVSKWMVRRSISCIRNWTWAGRLICSTVM